MCSVQHINYVILLPLYWCFIGAFLGEKQWGEEERELIWV